MLHVYLDGERLSPLCGYLVRRAPGHIHYDYGQTLAFQRRGEETTEHHHAVTKITSQSDLQLPKGCIQLKPLHMHITLKPAVSYR